MYSKSIILLSHVFDVCVVCVLLDHMEFHILQPIYHMKIHIFHAVCYLKFQIIVQCDSDRIHGNPCSQNCQKKTGSTVRFHLDCLFQWCAYVFSIPMLRKVKGRIHDPLNWTYEADANVSCGLMLHDAQTRVNIPPSAVMNEL